MSNRGHLLKGNELKPIIPKKRKEKKGQRKERKEKPPPEKKITFLSDPISGGDKVWSDA